MCQPERLCRVCRGPLRALPFYVANGKALICGRCLIEMLDKAQKSRQARRELENALMFWSVRGKW